MKEPPALPKPTDALIRSYLDKWDTLENYSLQEECLALLFKETCPSNENLVHVLLKVTALNQFYSTNIFDTYTVAKHIVRMNIGERLKAGDRALVNKLAVVTIKKKQKNFYSFASKYCNHHFPEQFPIYDSYVEKMLVRYSEIDRFVLFARHELKTYSKFVEIIVAFQDFYSLERFTLRQIDVFLWLAGKKYFPRDYTKKRSKH